MHQVLSQGQRRLAAIMFTDMVGYTTLGQRNESLSLALIREQRKLIRPILGRHNGREIKTMGDAFLVEFPSGLDGVRCAYDIQRTVKEFNISLQEERRLLLRIGIHLGDVVEDQGDISGDAVNVASRIQPLADDGGVCLTRQVYDQVHNKFEIPLSSIGVKQLKNVLEPVEVFRMDLPWSEGRKKDAVAPQDPRRVAVLPFTNISPDPADEYLADGMTEELIERLSQVRGLKVIARTSVMSFKKKEMKASEIGRELGVGSLVEGSVRKAGDKVRVTVQLIVPKTEEHLWSSRYDKDLSDIFKVQTEIAESVAKELKVQLVEAERRTLEVRPTQSTEAYTFYLKGRFYWNERTKPSVEKGIDYLRRAIEEDPNMALAYSDLADAHVIAGDYGMMPASEALAKVEEYAKVALRIDPTLSQPHAALAFVHERNFKWEESERELLEAIRLNESNVTARHWHAVHLFVTGKHQEAIAEWRKAIELDPLSLILGSNLGQHLARMGQSEGLEVLRRTIEMNESYPMAHVSLGYAYISSGMRQAAAEEAEKLLSIGGEGVFLEIAAVFYASAGLREKAITILSRILSRSGKEYTDPYRIAEIYAVLGDETNALKWLQKAVSEKSPGVVYVLSYPSFDSYKDNPTFKDLVRQVGLDTEVR